MGVTKDVKRTTKVLRTRKIRNYDEVRKWSYYLARQWVIKNLVPKGIDSCPKFRAYKRDGGELPKYFPRDIPRVFIRDNEPWKGWGHFLGRQDGVKGKGYFTFEEAREEMKKYPEITNSSLYKAWRPRPKGLPARPDVFYPDDWTDWPDFLGDHYLDASHSYKTKLTKKEVKMIKHQLSLGAPSAALARLFNVSDMQIYRIKIGENWSDVEV